MNCLNFKVRSKDYNKYFYCKLKKRKISNQECICCKHKQYKEVKPIKKTTIKRTSHKKSRRSKATDITKQVKLAVFLRDEGKCVICGNDKNVMPNAHYISRANGGLGIEKNIVTLCTEFTENKCHRKYDFGTEDEKKCCRNKIKDYLSSKYDDWNEEELVYKKYN